MKKGAFTHGGMYFDPVTRAEAPPGEPSHVICRRIADYAPSPVPTGAAVGRCAQCDAPVAYNPRGPHLDRPRLCMQCAGIQPAALDWWLRLPAPSVEQRLIGAIEQKRADLAKVTKKDGGVS